ncbi:unnamed protein product [Spirodela intermedia]|uniref:Uncharacterized protein n=1 Tax=Spirodela intermedia TaxID=51605 RepID=A0A7I8J750_SPIIN|nr:unnamed protein product [Spirodela intermedia]CAA6666056.1 unnamed protein product [Spirodela intermedia]
MAAAEGFGEGLGPLSIYKASRNIKRRENCLLYNALRSVYEDAVFVAEIAQLWPELPLLANLRCGLWYSSRVQGTCYFKSTDGHNNNWSFSTSRLNLHVATLAERWLPDRGFHEEGEALPDSMSKTIPIWACILNRAIANRLRVRNSGCGQKDGGMEECCAPDKTASSNGRQGWEDWDTSLHLPLWVSNAERAAIEDRLEEWTRQLEDCGADIDSLVLSLRKPLRPLWVSQTTVVWLNEVPDSDSWAFTPIILVSASSSNGIAPHRSTCEFSWHYIPGAGDDEESWARGLSPGLFWKHALELIQSGPDSCNQKVSELVEKDRVYRARRGFDAPQLPIKFHKRVADDGLPSGEPIVDFQLSDSGVRSGPPSLTSTDHYQCSVSWVGSTNLAVGATADVDYVSNSVDCVLDCDIGSRSPRSSESSDATAYLHLPIKTSKVDRFSLLKNLPSALKFAESNLSRGRKLLISCHNGEPNNRTNLVRTRSAISRTNHSDLSILSINVAGEDISICVCLAVFTCLFDEWGMVFCPL